MPSICAVKTGLFLLIFIAAPLAAQPARPQPRDPSQALDELSKIGQGDVYGEKRNRQLQSAALPLDALPEALREHEHYTIENLLLSPRESGALPIPVLLTVPKVTDAARPKGGFPVVVMVHGPGGSKRDMITTFAGELAEKGIASAAYDLPGHGERDPGMGGDVFGQRAGPQNLTAFFDGMARAVVDGRRVMDYLGTRKDLDERRTMVMGFSVGSHFACILAAVDKRARALVLFSGGTLAQLENIKNIPYLTKISQVYLATSHADNLAPRPVLMLNGEQDMVEPAKELFEAFKKPKELKWYPAGHLLNEQAKNDALEWTAARLGVKK